MKQIVLAGCFSITACLALAQQKSGMVTYERTVQVKMNLVMNGVENEVPQTRRDNYELLFGNNKSLYRAALQEPEEPQQEGGMQIRMVIVGSNDVLFNDFATGKRIEKREFQDKVFIVDDSIRSLNWKMTSETKTILGHPCLKATAIRTSASTQMTMTNGNLERREVKDTSAVEAWFATDIPVSAGPSEFQGQLPGLILELELGNGRQTYKALSISPEVNLAEIKEPEGKKRYTPEAYKKEREQMMQEMEQNMRSGRNSFRSN